MNKMMHKWVATMVLVGAVMAVPVQAATYTASGDTGQSLVLTLLGGAKKSVLDLVAKVSGSFTTLLSGDVDSLSLKYQDKKTKSLLQLKASSVKGSDIGSITLTPTAGSSIVVDSTYFSSSMKNFTVAVVPEPETYALLVLGLIGLGVARQRKKAREINAFPALTA
jgi:hypothetical protein